MGLSSTDPYSFPSVKRACCLGLHSDLLCHLGLCWHLLCHWAVFYELVCNLAQSWAFSWISLSWEIYSTSNSITCFLHPSSSVAYAATRARSSSLSFFSVVWATTQSCNSVSSLVSTIFLCASLHDWVRAMWRSAYYCLLTSRSFLSHPLVWVGSCSIVHSLGHSLHVLLNWNLQPGGVTSLT